LATKTKGGCLTIIMTDEIDNIQWDTLRKEKGSLIVGLWTALWLAVGFVYIIG